MSDELHRLWQQQQALRRMIDPPVDGIKLLGIGSAAMGFLKVEEERYRMLASLADVDSATKIVQDGEHQLRLLEEPMERMTRLGMFDTPPKLFNSFSAALETQPAFEHLFRLPELSELSSIAHEALEGASLARAMLGPLGTEDLVKAAMEAMSSPWLRMDEGLASAKAFSDIVAIGRGIDSLHAFNNDFAAALRFGLGDWRDVLTPAPEPLVNPDRRLGYYLERGFDPHLTDFTPSAFDEGLRIAGLQEPESTEDSIDQEDTFARARVAFDQLQRFEFALRRFIERAMLAAFGDDWMRRQLPPKMLDSWIEKRDKAVKAGHAELPLIDYADFTDYRAIIERKDNWKVVFMPVFVRVEDVRESFQRLFPVRIAVMHARFIAKDDELLLLVETKRVLKAIREV